MAIGKQNNPDLYYDVFLGKKYDIYKITTPPNTC